MTTSVIAGFALLLIVVRLLLLSLSLLIMIVLDKAEPVIPST